jgi:hypothetical protein
MPRVKGQDLTPKEREFCRFLVSGVPVYRAFFQAGYKATTNKYASMKGSAISARPNCAKYIAELKESQWLSSVMSIAEKRALMAEIARSKPQDITEESSIASISIDGDGKRSIQGPKVSDKLKAIELDARISGELSQENDSRTQIAIQLINDRLEIPAKEVKELEE